MRRASWTHRDYHCAWSTSSSLKILWLLGKKSPINFASWIHQSPNCLPQLKLWTVGNVLDRFQPHSEKKTRLSSYAAPQNLLTQMSAQKTVAFIKTWKNLVDREETGYYRRQRRHLLTLYQVQRWGIWGTEGPGICQSVFLVLLLSPTQITKAPLRQPLPPPSLSLWTSTQSFLSWAATVQPWENHIYLSFYAPVSSCAVESEGRERKNLLYVDGFAYFSHAFASRCNPAFFIIRSCISLQTLIYHSDAPSVTLRFVRLAKHQSVYTPRFISRRPSFTPGFHMTSDCERQPVIEAKCLLNQPFPGWK